LSYERYRSSHPKGKSFAAATLKIGVCFQELGMSDEAQAFYEEVVAKFPKSKEAEKANARLASINGKPRSKNP
jgi:TolA-binding protein